MLKNWIIKIRQRFSPLDVEEEVVEKIWRLFVHRSDCYAEQQEDGTYLLIKQSLTKAIIKQHLAGTKTIGIYQISPVDNTVKWGLYDFDLGKLAATTGFDLLKNQLTKIRAEIIKDKTISPQALLTELSGLKGLHFWVFFDPPVPAIVVNRMLRTIMERAGAQVNEIFPKQDTLTGKGFGNLVKLPLGVHRVSKRRSEIYNGESWNRLDSAHLLTIKPILTDPTETSMLREQIKRLRTRAKGH